MVMSKTKRYYDPTTDPYSRLLNKSVIIRIRGGETSTVLKGRLVEVGQYSLVLQSGQRLFVVNKGYVVYAEGNL